MVHSEQRCAAAAKGWDIANLRAANDHVRWCHAAIVCRITVDAPRDPSSAGVPRHQTTNIPGDPEGRRCYYRPS
jgi:hypothetical protein